MPCVVVPRYLATYSISFGKNPVDRQGRRRYPRQAWRCPLKSAYELAMERLGGPLRQYTETQKEKLADLDRLYDSKVAQARFDAASRRQNNANDPEKLRQIDEDLAIEIQSVEARRERKKEELRVQFEAEHDQK